MTESFGSIGRGVRVPAALPDRIRSNSLIKLLVFRALAALCAAGVVFCVSRYPLGWTGLAAGLALYAALLWHRPHWWLYALPAALPVLNLYPWTGWLYIEEFDLVVLTTLAVGYARASPRAPRAHLPPLATIATVVLFVSYLISAALPLREAQWAWSAVFTYNSPLNALRVLKGFLAAVLLVPLVLRAADDESAGPLQPIGWGLVAGCVVASIVVAFERLAFPGLMNFSSDYRVIGSFFEAHVGGAALDGFLALSLPFALVALLAARDALRIALMFAIVLAGTYAAFATFSRGLYAGIALAMAIICGIALLRESQGRWQFRALVALLSLGIGALLLVQVFSTGGYRTLAAALGTFAAALYFGGSTTAPHWRHALAMTLGLALLTVAATLLVPKGVYIAFAVSAAMFAILAAAERLERTGYPTLLLAALLWVGFNATAVGSYWGGSMALQDAVLAVVVAIALAIFSRTSPAPLWTTTLPTLTAALATGLLLAISIPVVGNYFMKDRVKAVSRDLQMREDHWTGTIDMHGQSLLETAFGAGLGSYAERYFWNHRAGDFPGVLLYVEEAGRRFVRLAGPRTTSATEPLRLSQRIDLDRGQRLQLSLDMRSSTPKSAIAINVCEKWLLYHESCRAPTPAPRPSTEWTRHVGEIDVSRLAAPRWWGTRPVTLTLAVGRRDVSVDVDNVSLTDESGRDLLANGDFSSGSDHWFFTSDRSHLPWHAKNLFLGVWFDQGWVGLGAFLAFLSCVVAGIRACVREARPFAAALAAGLAAFAVVGLFDTLVDATRLATLFYVLCFAAIATTRSVGTLFPVRPSERRVRLRRSAVS